MGNKGKVDELYDIPAIEGQQDIILGMLAQLKKSIQGFAGLELNLANSTTISATTTAIRGLAGAQAELTQSDTALHEAHAQYITDMRGMQQATAASAQILTSYGGTLGQNIQLQAQNKLAIANLKNEMKELQKALGDGTVSQGAYIQKSTELQEQQQRLTLANRELQQSINANIKEDQAANGSIDARVQRLGQLKDLYRQLSAEERENAAVGGQLLTVIQSEDAQIKALNGSLGNFQGNVGNYQSVALNFSTALEILRNELASVTKAVNDQTAAGTTSAAEMSVLVQQQELLNTLVNNSAAGYASETAELRANQQALQALAAAGLEQSAVYRELLNETARLKDNVNDLRQTLRVKASDTKFFDALVSGAQTLAAGFQIAQSAAALLGNEDKELQKTFFKLQAVLQLVNGLQTIGNALQKESAIRVAVTNGLASAQLALTRLQTAAESQNIVVRYAAAAAQRVLNLVMAANPILVVVGAIGLLVGALKAYSNSAGEAADKQAALNTQLEISNQLTKDAVDAIDEANTFITAKMNAQGREQSVIRAQNLKSLDEEIDRVKSRQDQERKAYNDATERIKFLSKNRSKASADELDALAKTRDAADQYFGDLFALENKRDLLVQQNNLAERKEAEADAKNNIGIANSKLQASIDVNNRIADNDRATTSARINATKTSTALQVQVIRNGLAAQLTDITITGTQRKQLEENAQTEIAKAQSDGLKKQKDLQDAAVDIRRKAAFDASKNSADGQIKDLENVANAENKTLAERLTAEGDALTLREKQIQGLADFELKTDLVNAEQKKKGRQLTEAEIFDITKLTADQRKVVTDKAESDIDNALGDHVNKRLGIIKSGTDKILAGIAEGTERQINGNAATVDAQLEALRDKYQQDVAGAGNNYDAQKVLLSKFEADSLVIIGNSTREQLQIQIGAAKQTVDLYADGTKERADAEKHLQDLQKTLNDEEFAKFKELQDKKLEAESEYSEKVKELRKSVADLVNTVATSVFTNQKNQLQAQSDAIDIQKTKEEEAVANSVATTQEKADATALIDARAQSQKEALDRRQKQIDQRAAEYQKLASVLQIGITTAESVFKIQAQAAVYSANIITAPLAALAYAQIPIVIGEGIAQAAIVAATPIPKYRHGTKDHQGGMAFVGDGGVHEVAVLPGMGAYITPNTETLVDLPKHAQVYENMESYFRSVHPQGLPDKHPEAFTFNLDGQFKKLSKDLIGGMERHKVNVHVNQDWSGVHVSLETVSHWDAYINQHILH